VLVKLQATTRIQAETVEKTILVNGNMGWVQGCLSSTLFNKITLSSNIKTAL
jgi:hypothetical protein